MQLHKGIVLQAKWAIGGPISILDNLLGRIEVRPKGKPYMLVPSALVSYTVGSYRLKTISIDNIVLEGMPLELAKEHLTFIHGMLELAYYSCFPAQPCQEIFESMWALFSCDQLHDWSKILAVAHMLMLIGMHDRQVPISGVIFDYLIYLKPGAMLEEYLNGCQRNDLLRWIERSLLVHPYAKKLRIWLNLYEALHDGI